MNDALVIYCPKDTERLRYTLNWIFTEQLKLNYRIVSNSDGLSTLPFFISYGSHFDNALSIADTGLLWETGIKHKEMIVGNWNNLPTFFADDAFNIPFDIFSAIFFLISRYEEYYSYNGDKHGRYPATESIMYKHGWLERPLADEWIMCFRNLLIDKFKLTVHAPQFSFQPTYDIDIAYSFLQKGFKRTSGAVVKDLLTGNLASVNMRGKVLAGALQDPYDSFDYMQHLHTQHAITPLYFVLAALHTTPFDKNISPLNEKMRALIKALSEEGGVGMHPSYYSDDDNRIFNTEKKTLEDITAKHITMSRQHYIKMSLPKTYEYLIANGIDTDYSMGYATHLGFRAGTGFSFLWYNLAKEQATNLRIHTFCFMDTTARFEMNLPVDEAFRRLELMAGILEKSRSRMITIFHNFSLGTDRGWKGWNTAYGLFLDKYFGANANNGV